MSERPAAQVHDDPNSSPVDGPTQWPLRHFKPLLEELLAIGKVRAFRNNIRYTHLPENTGALRLGMPKRVLLALSSRMLATVGTRSLPGCAHIVLKTDFEHINYRPAGDQGQDFLLDRPHAVRRRLEGGLKS